MKPIPGFSNYFITKDGKVWSEYRRRGKGQWLIPEILHTGHLRIMLCDNKKRYRKRIHHLVLETYVGPCPKGMECRHLNGNPQDNRLENLKWGTKSENAKDAVLHGTSAGFQKKGEQNHNAKLTEDQVRLIYASYHNGLHTQQELADYFGVSQQHISKIILGNRWTHIKEHSPTTEQTQAGPSGPSPRP